MAQKPWYENEREAVLRLLGMEDNPDISLADLRGMTGYGADVEQVARPRPTDYMHQVVASVFDTPYMTNALDNAFSQVMERGAVPTGLVLIEKGSISDPATPRPTWDGVVEWWINEGGAVPENIRGGDIISVVSTVPLPWTPGSLEELVAWYYPSGSGVADGSTLVSVPDKSGNNNTLAVTGSGISYDADGLNGKPAFVFDGTSYMRTDAAPVQAVGNTGAATFAFTAQQNTATTMTIWDQSTGSSGAGEIFLSSVSGYVARRLLDGSASQIAGGTIDTDPHVHVVILNGASSAYYVDGTLVASGTTGNTAISRLQIGARGNPTRTTFFNGFLGDFLYISKAINETERTELTTWLASRAGVEL